MEKKLILKSTHHMYIIFIREKHTSKNETVYFYLTYARQSCTHIK